MKTVRAKFAVSYIAKQPDGSAVVNMTAVTSGCEENKSFSEYTPSGSIQMTISNGKPAQELFEPGKEYYVDFTPAN